MHVCDGFCTYTSLVVEKRKEYNRKENGSLGVILELFVFSSFVFYFDYADLRLFLFWMTENRFEVGITR